MMNPNNLSAKLQNDQANNVIVMLNDMKQSLKVAKLVTSNSFEFIEIIKRTSKDLNFLVDHLPLFKPTEFNDKMKLKFKETFQNVITKNMVIQNSQKINLINSKQFESIFSVNGGGSESFQKNYITAPIN